MSGPRAPHSLRHEPQSTPLKFEEPLKASDQRKRQQEVFRLPIGTLAQRCS
jgi:hypothetical protein